jgi:hypothetical protein
VIRAFVRVFAGAPVPAPPVALPPGVVVTRGRLIPEIAGRLSGMRRAAAATTLGDTIIVHPAASLTDRLLRHELAHVRQWRAAPIVFPVQYIWNHFRHGYRDNPFEVEARLAERDQETAHGDIER